MARTPRTSAVVTLMLLLVAGLYGLAFPAEQPVAIFHAFDQPYREVEQFVCELAAHGYSHVQLAPAQQSNPDPAWWARYQPVDYTVIDGRGSEEDLRRLIGRAHGCDVKVIADVVFNHMANMEAFRDLRFPHLSPQDFHPPCGINYDDGNRSSELHCRLGDLPDLDQRRESVQRVHRAHLHTLLDLGIDGFRLDAAKHMPADLIKAVYMDFIDAASRGNTWNYLEVITDADTRAEDYTWVAAVTDFTLYRAMKAAFSFGGDMRALRVPRAVDDPRSVTFGRNHDTIRALNAQAIDPYDDPSDAHLATAYVLARERGTPLVLNWDHADVPYLKHGVKFRQVMRQRGAAGHHVQETVLAAVDSPTVLLMERGSEGFFVVNKGADRFDVPMLDVTLTNLEGCYRELRNRFTVAVERRNNGQKFVTLWGTWDRGGMEVHARDALYFIREPWPECQTG
jgi:alpha-amylase